MLETILSVMLVLFVVPLIFQGVFNLYLTLYGWESTERIRQTRASDKPRKPSTGFSVLLPVYHEEEVIGETLRKLSLVDYPADLVELIVIARVSDTATIKAIKKSIRDNKIKNAKLLVYKGIVPGKPPQLNAGLKIARKKIVTIFDAEDDVSPKLFSAMNNVFLNRKPDIVQGGVQLMDYHAQWFSLLNVLEYFFWFRSCMHYFAKIGAMPLGGNTVFFHRRHLNKIGGWDESLLTEDADIGFRLSVLGKKTVVVYDPELITKEETPPTTEQFIKQRTRWIQGFLQIIKKGDLYKLATRKQRLLALYVMTALIMHAILLVVTPIFIIVGTVADVPAYISVLSFAPLGILFCLLAALCVGLYELSKEQELHIKWRWYAVLIVTFPFYQILLGYSSVRAIRRHFAGAANWEKTKHTGGHRKEVGASASVSLHTAVEPSGEYA